MDALVVDDHELYREVLRIVLIEIGFSVTCSENGLNALQVLTKSPDAFYHLIVVDYNMPHMSGIELLQKIIQMKIKYKKVILLLPGNAESLNISSFFQDQSEIRLVSKDLPLSELKRIYFKV